MKLLRILLIFVCGTIAFGASAERVNGALPAASQAWIKAHPTIVVATYTEGYAPFESVSDGLVSGLAPDYLRALAERLGLGIRWRTYTDWPAAMAAVGRGDADLLMNVAPTPAREGVLRLSRPYYEAVPVLALRRDETRIVRASDLHGGTIAAAVGHAEEDALRRYMPDVTLRTAPSLVASLRQLDKGQADAVLGDPRALARAIENAGLEDRLKLGPAAALPIATLSFAIAANRNRAPLLTALDDTLGDLSAPDHARLRAPWLGAEPPAPRDEPGVPLSAMERIWLARLPILRVGIDPTAAPLSMNGPDGQAEGLALDYMLEALHTLGVRTETVHTADWTETVRKASAGEIDLLPAASPRNGELGKRFDFSTPYIEFPVIIVTRENFVTISGPADLAGRRIAANLAQGAVAAAVARLPQVTVTDVRTAAAGLEAVASDRVDAYVGDIATAEFLIRRDYPARLRLAAPTDEKAALAIALNRQYAPLLPLLDRALARLPERRAQTIRNTWLRSEYTWGGSWREIARKVGPAGSAALLLLLGITYAYVRLRRETRRRVRSEEQLADVTRHIPAVVYRFRYHSDGRIEFVYVGGNPEPIFDVPASTFMHDERAAFARIDPRDQGTLLATVMESATTLAPMQAYMRIRDSEPERWVASHALPRRVGDVVEFTGYWIDVSGQRRQSAQLAAAKLAAESATQAKSQFLATMSHEIRTPMHGVIGMLELLGDTPLEPAQKRLLDTAGTSAEALLQILDDVLDLSRIEAGRMPVEETPVDLRQLVMGVVDLFAWKSHDKGLSVDLHIDTAVASLLVTDGARLRQVLLNLVSNAIKFTQGGGILVGVDVVEDTVLRQHLRLSVTDTGIGVAVEDIARLFAPFSQAETSTTRRFGGSGLGLTISRHLVELLGGRIEMTSQPARGTRVVVDLDLAVHRAPSQPVAPAPMPSAALRPLDVLVAEDHATNRELIAAQLDRLGHRHALAADGEQALCMLTENHFDVLLTDLHMPGMDGYHLTRTLRERGLTIRIVAMTANAMRGERERCLAAGMDDFVTKPLRLSALHDALLAPAETTASALWDTDAWRDTFGDLSVLPALIARFESATRDDIAAAATLRDAPAAADWVHRIVGGMRIFGESPEAAQAERLEHDLRGVHAEAALHTLPAFVTRLEAYLVRLRREGEAQVND